MSSATIARWSMPLVYTAFPLHGGKERPQGGDEGLRVLAGDIVARLDLDDLQARVGGLHFLHGLGGVQVGARAADGQDRAPNFADQLPHVDAEPGPFRASELIPEMGVALGARRRVLRRVVDEREGRYALRVLRRDVGRAASAHRVADE